MKRFEKFLNGIRSLPEEARKLFAVVSLIVAATLLFIGWSALTSSRLGDLINGSPQVASLAVNPALDRGKFAPPFSEGAGFKGGVKQELFPQETNSISPLAGISDITKSAFSFMEWGVEGAWRYIYEPLR